MTEDLPEQPPLPVTGQLLARIGAVLDAAGPVLGADDVGVMLLDEQGHLGVLGTRGPAAAELEAAQRRLGGGPCLECVRAGHPVAVTDLAGDPGYRLLWAELTGARGAGGEDGPARAVASVPIRVEQAVVGTLNLVRTGPHAWRDTQIRAAQAYADVLGTLLRHVAQQTPVPPADPEALGTAATGTAATGTAATGTAATGTAAQEPTGQEATGETTR